MQFSPKLKNAMKDIENILKRYDIAGVVVLHTPGHSEHLLRINPTYSCAKIDGDRVTLKAKLSHYNGDAAARDEKGRDSANMFKLLGEHGGKTFLMLMEVSDELDRIVNAEHGEGGFTSQTTQDN